MATKKSTAANKQYKAWYLSDELYFSDSVEGAAECYYDGDEIVVYEMVEVGRFVLNSKPTLTPIK